jgi:hypothetical protein
VKSLVVGREQHFACGFPLTFLFFFFSSLRARQAIATRLDRSGRRACCIIHIDFALGRSGREGRYAGMPAGRW